MSALAIQHKAAVDHSLFLHCTMIRSRGTLLPTNSSMVQVHHKGLRELVTTVPWDAGAKALVDALSQLEREEAVLTRLNFVATSALDTSILAQSK